MPIRVLAGGMRGVLALGLIAGLAACTNPPPSPPGPVERVHPPQGAAAEPLPGVAVPKVG